MEKLSIYSYLDYRLFIKDWVKYTKSTDLKITQAHIAEGLRIKGPFLSKVMGARANFSEDQLFLLAQFFDLEIQERDFLLLLSSLERTALVDRKNEILKKIKKIQGNKLSTHESIHTTKLESSEESARSKYYLDPYHLFVHVALSIERYSEKPSLILNELDITQVELEEIIKNLRDLNLVMNIGARIILTETQVHLKSDEPLCSPHQALLRQISSQRMLRGKSEDYSLALTFSCSEADKEKIKHKFLEFLKTFDKILDKARDEAVYQMNFDLFRWL